MLTNNELNAIKERLHKASPPPWNMSALNFVNNKLGIIADWDESNDQNNYNFIANSRTDVVNLLEDIQEYKSKISDYKAKLALKEAEISILQETIGKLKAMISSKTA